MKKFTKKILSVALAATVSVSSLYTSGDLIKAATDVTAKDYKEATLTVKFKPNPKDKGTPQIHAYDRKPGEKPGSGTSKVFTPNTSSNKKDYVEMKKEADGTYSYSIDTRYGYAYVIIDTGNNRYPIEEDKKDNSYFIESSVMIDASQATEASKVSPTPTTFSAITTSTPTPTITPTVTPTSTPNATTKSVTVFFNGPDGWSGIPCLYAYHRPIGQPENSNTSVKNFGEFPGTKMTKDSTAKSGKWYYYTFDINTADTTYIIFATEDKKKQFPAGTGYTLTATSWFDARISNPTLTTTKPGSYDGVVPSATPATTAPATTAPATTAPATPTATPIAATIVETAKPVNGPHVTTNYGQKATFADGSDTVQDYLYVELNLAGGATSATYVLDDGLPKTITENSVIKVGEGKIANAPITLKVTSTDGTKTNTQTFTYTKLPNYNNTVKTVATAVIKKALGIVKAAATSQTYNVKFTAPKDWKGTVYAYAYYHKNDTAKTLVEALGKWPGKAATKNADGTYTTTVNTEIGSAYVMFSNYENGKETAKLPTGWKTGSDGKPLTDTAGNYIGVDGYLVSANSSIDGLTGKVTADTSATETPSMKAYFGAEKSAPQVNTTKQKISAVVKDASGTPHFTFYVNDNKLYEGTNNSADWDPTNLKVKVYSLKVVIKDDKNTIELKKNYTITDSTGATPEPTATPIITPTATVPATATATATAIAPTATATTEVSADPAATPTASATTTAPSDATGNPDVTSTPDAIPTASADVSTSPEVVPTATVVPTIAPTAVPPVTTGGSVLTPDQAPNAVASASAVTGSVTFAKLNKTAGEDVVIKVATTNKKSDAKYTYSYYVNSKAIATKTTKTSATWTTSKKGTYSIKVIVYENGEQACVISSSYTVKARVITIQSFKANKKSGQKKNTKITLIAKAKATKGKVSYKFAVQKKNGKIKTLKGFSTKKKFIWKPTQKGTYKLYVYVKNGKGVLVKKTLNFKIK